MKNTSIPRKNHKGPKSNIKNLSLRPCFTKKIVLRIISREEHVIKNKFVTIRQNVDKECRIIVTRFKDGINDNKRVRSQTMPRELA